MKPTGRKFSYLFVLMIFLASCGTGKKIVDDSRGVKLTGEEHFRAVIRNTPSFQTFTSRLRMTLPVDGRKKKSFNGTLKIDKNRLIQISLVAPVIRTEGARIEITPDRILVIDRVNHLYAEAPVSEFLSTLPAGSDFQTLQSLFTNALFIPGNEPVTEDLYHSFRLGDSTRNGYVLGGLAKELSYMFHTSTRGNRLRETVIEDRVTQGKINWKYDDFIDAGDIIFPSLMTLEISDAGKNKKSRITMELSRIVVDENEIRPASIPGKYDKVALQDLLQMVETL